MGGRRGGGERKTEMKLAPQAERARRGARSRGGFGHQKTGKNGNKGPGPPLTTVGARLPRQAIARTLINPTPPMPSFSTLRQRSPKEFNELVNFLSSLR